MENKILFIKRADRIDNLSVFWILPYNHTIEGP